MQHGVIIPDNQFTGRPLVPVYIFRLRGQSNDLLNNFSTLLIVNTVKRKRIEIQIKYFSSCYGMNLYEFPLCQTGGNASRSSTVSGMNESGSDSSSGSLWAWKLDKTLTDSRFTFKVSGARS